MMLQPSAVAGTVATAPPECRGLVPAGQQGRENHQGYPQGGVKHRETISIAISEFRVPYG